MISTSTAAPFLASNMPEDVVGAVIFFLSAQAGFVTGQLIPVNGGFVFN